MSARAGACFDTSGLFEPESIHPETPFSRVIATAGADTPLLRGIDMIRIDANSGTLQTISRTRDIYNCPAMLDIPGPNTPRHASCLLTTTEMLVFAAAETFEWVNLRDVKSIDAIDAARPFIHESIRLSVTISSNDIHRAELMEICEAADALVIDRPALLAKYSEAECEDFIMLAIHHGELAKHPVYVLDAPFCQKNALGTTDMADLRRLQSYRRAGTQGFILSEESTRRLNAHGPVDLSQLLDSMPSQQGKRRSNTLKLRAMRSAAKIQGNIMPMESMNSIKHIKKPLIVD